MKKVKQPHCEKMVILEEKLLKEAIGSSSYMIAYRIDQPDPAPTDGDRP
jgi:hypothetical protein